MLFYSIPYKDTNVLAHRLLDTFGSLNGVLNASIESLTQVDGIGDNSAILIKLFRDVAEFYNEKMLKKELTLSEKDAENVIKTKMLSETVEAYYLVFIDNYGRIRDVERVCGNEQNLEICNRKFAKTVLSSRFKNVVIAHNHLSSFAAPKPQDIAVAKSVVPFLRSISINVLDYRIYTEEEQYSLKTNPKLRSLFI